MVIKCNCFVYHDFFFFLIDHVTWNFFGSCFGPLMFKSQFRPSPLGIFYPVKFHCCCWCCSSSLWLCISKITNQIIFEVLIYPNNKHGLNAYLHNTLNNQKDPRNLEYHNLTNLYIYIIIGETERDSNYNFKLKL